MTAYVLVDGAWMGGWCWQAVARPLRAVGHDVYPATLTGLGERSHLAGPEVGGGNFLSDTRPEAKAAELLALPDVHYRVRRVADGAKAPGGHSHA